MFFFFAYKHGYSLSEVSRIAILETDLGALKECSGKESEGLTRIKSHHCCLGTIVIDSETSQNMSDLKNSQLFLSRGLINRLL